MTMLSQIAARDTGALRDRSLDMCLAVEALHDDGPALPAADAWHRTPLARQIIADMRACEALSRRLDEAYGGDSGLATVYWQIGTLEDALSLKRPSNRFTTLDQFADRLEVLRDDAIDAARLTAYPASWSSHAEEFDAYSGRLERHFDTVALAVAANVIGATGVEVGL